MSEVDELKAEVERLQADIDANYSDKALHQRYTDLALHNNRLHTAAWKVIEYRKRAGALGFQLEKMDDLLRLMEIILSESTEAS
jgi:hypothetical protein